MCKVLSFVLLSVVLGVVGCAGEEFTSHYRTANNESIAFNEDIGYVTVTSANMEGVFSGQSVDQIAYVAGNSDKQATRVQIVSEPHHDDDVEIVMGLTALFGDAGLDEFDRKIGLGCSGLEFGAWTTDRPAVQNSHVIRKFGDTTSVEFEYSFKNDEWLLGSFTFVLN